MSVLLEFHLNVQNWVGFGCCFFSKTFLESSSYAEWKSLDRTMWIIHFYPPPTKLISMPCFLLLLTLPMSNPTNKLPSILLKRNLTTKITFHDFEVIPVTLSLKLLQGFWNESHPEKMLAHAQWPQNLVCTQTFCFVLWILPVCIFILLFFMLYCLCITVAPIISPVNYLWSAHPPLP